MREEGIKLAQKNAKNGFKTPELKTLEQGCSTTLVAALDPSLAVLSGTYLEDGDVAEAEDYAIDKENAERVWALAEKLVGQKFSY